MIGRGWLAAGVSALAVGSVVVVLSPSSSAAGCGASAGGSDGWTRVGATLDPTYGGGAFPQYYNGGMSYAELGAAPGYPNYAGGLLARALGVKGDARGLPGGYALMIRAVGSRGPGVRVVKSDVGSGQAGDPHYMIDLHPAVANAIGFTGKQDVEVRPAAGGAGGGGACVLGPVDVQRLVQMAVQVEGAPYSTPGHAAAFRETAAQVKAGGTDCSGFVSWLMGPMGLRIWSAPLDTTVIPSASGLRPGRGQFVTLHNNPLPGMSGHVWITIGSRSWEEGGSQGNEHEMTQAEVGYYAASGQFQDWHPAGL